jgi:hypothetical protein
MKVFVCFEGYEVKLVFATKDEEVAKVWSRKREGNGYQAVEVYDSEPLKLGSALSPGS